MLYARCYDDVNIMLNQGPQVGFRSRNPIEVSTAPGYRQEIIAHTWVSQVTA